MPKIKLPILDGEGSPLEEMEKENAKADRDALKKRAKDEADRIKSERDRRRREKA